MSAKDTELIGKSRRITKEQREVLADHLVTSSKASDNKKLEEMKVSVIDTTMQKFLEPYQHLIAQLPKKWTHVIETDHIFGVEPSHWSYRDRIFAKPSRSMLTLSGTRTIPHIDPEEPEHKEIHHLLEKTREFEVKLNEQKSQLKSKTLAALKSFTTTKQLFQKWPEAYKVYVKLFPEPQQVTLPDIPREQLNKELGLK